MTIDLKTSTLATSLSGTEVLFGATAATGTPERIPASLFATEPIIGRTVAANDTAVLGDLGSTIISNFTSGNIAITIPTDANAGWSATDTNLLTQYRAGVATVSFVAAGGVTLHQPSTFSAPAQYDLLGAMQIGPNEWTLISGTPAVSGGAWGGITGTLSAQTDLQTALNAKAATANTPIILSISGVPAGIAPSGTVGSNGALNLGSNVLPVIYSGIWLEFPINAVFSGSAAGMYWCVMSSTSVGTIYNNTRVATDPLTPPASPAAVSGTGISYTGLTNSIALVHATIPANAMGINGAVKLLCNASSTSGTSAKLPVIIFGGVSANGLNMAAANLSGQFQVTVHNKGSAAKQLCPGNTIMDTGNGSSTAATRMTVDTTANVTFGLSALIQTATDIFVLEDHVVTLYPGA